MDRMRSTYYPGVCTKPGKLTKQVLLYWFRLPFEVRSKY